MRAGVATPGVAELGSEGLFNSWFILLLVLQQEQEELFLLRRMNTAKLAVLYLWYQVLTAARIYTAAGQPHVFICYSQYST